MSFQRLGIILTAVNLVLLIFVLVVLAQIRGTAVAQEVTPVLRGRALEIVDERGRVRASLNVYPPNTPKNGDGSETVLFRLITERGRPSVKISASEQLAAVRRSFGHEENVRAIVGERHGQFIEIEK